MSEERSEAPTAKKKKESRKEGQVPRTQELGSWTTLAVFALVLDLALGWELGSLRELMASSFRGVAEPTSETAITLLGDGFRHILLALVVLGSGVLVVGVTAAVSQGGFYLATKAVKPKASKLNPVPGAKRMFGTQAWWELSKTLVKATVVAFIAYLAVREIVPLIGGLVPISTTLEAVHERVGWLLRTAAVAGLVMAGADYAFQRRKVGKQVRMTKHEVKQEHKQTEGDPMLKSAIRSRQLAAARSRMMSDVATADVVLVNPTHVAVALRYQPSAGAPRVVAKGAGAVAAKIREKAAQTDIPQVRDVPLARALYQSCTVGQEVPAELFAAVAQVLAFVIGRKTQGRSGGTHASPRAADTLPAVPRGRRRPPGSPGPARPRPAG